MKVGIIYQSYMDSEGRQRRIGGIETLIESLGRVIARMGWEPELFQVGNRDFCVEDSAIKVFGIACEKRPKRFQRSAMYQTALTHLRGHDHILIFGADFCSVPTRDRRAIAIQHGIWWDAPSNYLGTPGYLKMLGLNGFWRAYGGFRARKFFDNCYNRVCVDYNFLNWYRTRVFGDVTGRIWVVPNFARVPEKQSIRAESGLVRIIFARRFCPVRGSFLFAEALKRTLNKFPNCVATFAGDGSDEVKLREMFAGNDRVTFSRYVSTESVGIHRQYDIAVVPSLGSEGTSFSVVEAMAAGCAVVATNIGGITNLIINRYNGLLVNPDLEELCAALSELIEDREKRNMYGQRAYDTAKAAFSFERWQEAWRSILLEVAKEDNSTIL